MAKFAVYVLDPFHGDAVTRLLDDPDVDAVLYTDPAKADWHEKAEGIMIRGSIIREADFEKASKLKVILKQGVGVDSIDLEAAKRHGVRVYNTPGLNSEAVAELVMALALNLGRRVGEMDRAIRRGETLVPSKLLIKSLYSRTVGIIGMGNIGVEVAKKWLGAMDATIVAYDPYAPKDAWANIPHTRADSLNALLPVSDIVTIHVPLTPETKGLIGAKELELMKDEGILLNLARGGIIDEPALLQTLRSKKLWGVGLDAMDVEPPTLKAYHEFLEHENLLLTPHVGGGTIENNRRSGVAAAESLVTALKGGNPVGRQA